MSAGDGHRQQVILLGLLSQIGKSHLELENLSKYQVVW